MSWPKLKLAEVAEIERKGINPSSIVSGTKYIGLEHIESGGSITGAQKVSNGELASTKFLFGPNHILYGKLRPYLAKIALPDFEGVCSTDILPINPGPKLDRKFLTYFLRQPTMVEYATSRTTGANLPRLSPTVLAEFEIPLPPLHEQKRIAAILDQADDLRRLRQRAIDRLNELGRAIFYEMFGDPVTNPMGWTIEKCASLCERITVGIVVKPASYYQPSGVPAIRGTNIKPEGIDLGDVVYFSERDNETRLSKTRVWEGDLVIVRSGRPGLAAVVPKELNGVNSIDVLIATPNKQKTRAYFLRDLINSNSGKAIVLSESRGQIQQHFNVGSLSDADLIVPPLPLQKEYEKIIWDLERQTAVFQKASDKTGSLFCTLQYRAFRGEL